MAVSMGGYLGSRMLSRELLYQTFEGLHRHAIDAIGQSKEAALQLRPQVRVLDGFNSVRISLREKKVSTDAGGVFAA
jgi:hypothetical protein